MCASCERPGRSDEPLARLPGVARVAFVPAADASFRCAQLVVLELAAVPPLPSAVRIALGERSHTSRAFASLNPLPSCSTGCIDIDRLSRVLSDALRAPGGALGAGYLEL